MPKISIRLDGGMSPAECVRLACAAEAAGFASVWFAENAFARGILPAAAACAAATSRIAINAGVFNPYSRHPTMMAMEIAALDELAGGRVGLGLGSGIAAATRRLAIDPDKPLPALRDALAIVRGLLAGETVDHAGDHFSARGVALECPARADLPIYLAGRGRLTVKFAGEAADGLIVSNMCTVAFAGGLAATVAAARGSRPPAAIVQYMPAAVGADGDAAVKRALGAVGAMVPRYWALAAKVPAAKAALTEGAGIDDETFADAARRLADEPADRALDGRFAHAFALAGTVDDCLARAADYRAAGVTELALTFSGPDAADEIAALGRALA
nr:LLM class flavin-dependent oxidoreductase [Acuticoccus mangrovi]